MFTPAKFALRGGQNAVWGFTALIEAAMVLVGWRVSQSKESTGTGW